MNFLLIVIPVFAVIAAYWCGRTDGYWLRAEEDRHEQRDQSLPVPTDLREGLPSR